MKRTGPPERRKPLKRTAWHRVNAEPKQRRRATGKRRSKRSGFSPKVRAEIIERCGGVCEARIRGVCTGRGHHAHHVERRWRGNHTAENGRWLCAACHGWVHAHVAEAKALGLLASY